MRNCRGMSIGMYKHNLWKSAEWINRLHYCHGFVKMYKSIINSTQKIIYYSCPTSIQPF